jgi:hypothetical protein
VIRSPGVVKRQWSGICAGTGCALQILPICWARPHGAFGKASGVTSTGGSSGQGHCTQPSRRPWFFFLRALSVSFGPSPLQAKPSAQQVFSQIVEPVRPAIIAKAAEPLPVPVASLRKRRGRWVDADIQFDEQPWLQEGDALDAEPAPGAPVLPDEWNPDAPCLDQVHALTIATQARVTGVPVRYLPHQRLSDLYWLFQASWDRLAECLPEEQRLPAAPAFRTFRRRWWRWQPALKFRKASQHTQCQTCAEIQRPLRRPRASWAERTQAAAALQQHYKDQYLDRMLYWSLRFAARAGQDA